MPSAGFATVISSPLLGLDLQSQGTRTTSPLGNGCTLRSSRSLRGSDAFWQSIQTGLEEPR